MKKNLINSVLLFAAALLLLFGVVYAWITLTPAVRVQQFVVNVNNYSADLRLDIKRNDDEYTEAVSAADVYELFHNTLPNDRLYFRLSITNNGNHPVTADIWMLGVFSENENEGYDMLDVFFLDGEVRPRRHGLSRGGRTGRAGHPARPGIKPVPFEQHHRCQSRFSDIRRSGIFGESDAGAGIHPRI